MTVLLITCYKCQRPVEKLYVEIDIATDKKKFTVFCHGEQETTYLSVDDVMDAHVTGGIAFERPRLSGEVL